MTSVITSRRHGVNGSLAIKAPCKTATTANITLSGEQTIDGVACVAGNRVLVKDQTTGSENGIYACNTSTWQREPDWDGSRDVVEGTSVYVTDGSTTTGHWRVTTSDPITPGTTSVTLVASDIDSTLRSDLASTATDDGTKGFHLVNYPPLSGEIGVTDYEYEWGDLRRFGVTGDGAADDSAEIANAITSALTGGKIFGQADHTYNFGTITGDSAKITVTKNIHIDWQGGKLLCAGENDAAYTSTVLFKFEDCRADMRDYVFEDSAFDIASGPSRGVMPVLINSAALSTENHKIGPFHVIKGQSLLTVASDTPDTYRATGIELTGSCTAENVYYGVNLARNGDSVKGRFNVSGICNRAVFAYGVKNIDIDFYAETGQASSSNLFISHANSATAANNTDTTNIRVRGRFGEMGGAVVIADQPRDTTTGAGVYKDIDIECIINTLGSNLQQSASVNHPLVKIGAFNTSSGYITTEITQTIDNLRVKLLPSTTVNTHGKLSSPVHVYASSPNYGTFEFPVDTQVNRANVFPENAGGDTFRVPTIKTDGWFFRSINGALTDGAAGVTRALYIPIKYLSPIQRNSNVNLNLQVSAFKDTTSGKATMSDYYLIGYLASTGAITVTDAYQKSVRNTGGIAPTIAIVAADPYSSGVNDHIKVTLVDSSTTNGYNDASAQMTVKVTPIA